MSPDAAAAEGRVGLRAFAAPGCEGWRVVAPREAEERLGRAVLAEAARDVCACAPTEGAGLVRTGAGTFFFARTNPQPQLVCGQRASPSTLTRMAKCWATARW